jgi:hypothetical protein
MQYNPCRSSIEDYEFMTAQWWDLPNRRRAKVSEEQLEENCDSGAEPRRKNPSIRRVVTAVKCLAYA